MDCKHEWRMYQRNTVCVKCNSNIINVLAEQEREIRRLESKFDEIFQISTSLASYPQNEKLRDIIEICNKRAELLAEVQK